MRIYQLTQLRLILVLSSSLFGFSLQGQNYSVQNGYQVNPFLINPAAASSEFSQLFTSYRTQWVGMPGAPKYISVGFNTLFDKTRAGIGLKASSFSRGILTTSDISATYSYGIPVSKTTKVFMGLSGGMLAQSINWNMVTDDTDPTLAAVGKAAIPTVSFGLLIKNSSGLNFGVTMPQLIRSEHLNNTFQIVPDNLVVMAYYSNWHPVTSKVKSHNRSRKSANNKKNGNPFEFYSLYRYTRFGGQAEVFAKLNAKNAWISAGYRQGYGIIPGLGFNLGKVSIQYTFESGLAGDIPLKSHEIGLFAKLGEKKTFKGDGEKTKPVAPQPSKPRFSDNSPKLAKANTNKTKAKNNQAIAKNNTKANTNSQTTNSGNTPRNRENTNTIPDVPITEEKPLVTEEKKPVETKPVVTEEKKPIVETKPVVTEEKKPVETKPVETEEKKPVVIEEKKPVETKPIVTEEKKPVVETKPEVTEEKKPVVETKPVVTEEKKPVETKPDPNKPVVLTEEEQHAHEQDVLNRLEEHSDNPTETHEEEHPHAERHEFVRRGEHASEMDLGDYVIIGVFRSEANAKRVSDGYRNLGFSEVDYGFQSGKNLWFVHVAGSDDIEEARAMRNKYRKMKMFKDAWLLTVHQ
jgi:type IX secretion system PorP/SprF family membrane protein